MEEQADRLNKLINNEAVYRSAPATPGLLTTNDYTSFSNNVNCEAKLTSRKFV